MGAIGNFVAGAAGAGANLFGAQAIQQMKDQGDMLKAQRIAEIAQNYKIQDEDRAVTRTDVQRTQYGAEYTKALADAKAANPDGKPEDISSATLSNLAGVGRVTPEVMVHDRSATAQNKQAEARDKYYQSLGDKNALTEARMAANQKALLDKQEGREAREEANQQRLLTGKAIDALGGSIKAAGVELANPMTDPERKKVLTDEITNSKTDLAKLIKTISKAGISGDEIAAPQKPFNPADFGLKTDKPAGAIPSAAPTNAPLSPAKPAQNVEPDEIGDSVDAAKRGLTLLKTQKPMAPGAIARANNPQAMENYEAKLADWQAKYADAQSTFDEAQRKYEKSLPTYKSNAYQGKTGAR